MERGSDAVNRSLDECVTLEYILVGDLRDLLDEPPTEVTRNWLKAVLDALIDTLPKQRALQEQGGGFLAEVVEEFPWWYGHVEQLHTEQVALYDRLRELRSAIVRVAEFELVAAGVRRDLQDWMTRLVAFHRHERRLLQEAFTFDVGAGD